MSSVGVDSVGSAHDGKSDRVEGIDRVRVAMIAEIQGFQRLFCANQVEQMEWICPDALEREQQPE